VELPDRTKFQVPTYGSENNKEYLVHIIVVLRLVELKGTADEVKEAFAVLVKVRKEMSPFFNFPEDETPAEKEARKKKLANLNKSLKAKKSLGVNQAQKAYKLFHCFIVGKARMQWDEIVNEMHTKNPWIGVNGKSTKGIHVKSWISFMDCIELHKLTVFPADAAEKQCYYMQQTIKKPQQVTVRKFVSRMGILNDYLAYLPTVFDSSIAIAGTKKMNVPFNKADLARIVLNSVPSSWVNQYNMTHSMLPKNPRALLNDLEAIEQVMDEKQDATLKAKAKEATAASAPKEVPRSILRLENPVNCESQRRLGPASFANTARQRVGPTSLTIPRNAIGTTEMGIPFPLSKVSLQMQRSPLKKGATSRLLV
jgi:hypothetical protein